MKRSPLTCAPLSLLLALALGLGAPACGDDPPCTRFKAELLDALRARNPDLDAPAETYHQTYRELVYSIRSRGCSLPDLGTRPLLCDLGDPVEPCPPGYACVPAGPEVCQRR